MYKIDLLRQIEANTRGGAVSDCYSKYDLWRMIERNTRSKPVLLKKWTPNYTGQGYVEIPEWRGVAGDVLEFTALRGVTSEILGLFNNGIYEYGNKFDWDGYPDLYTFFVNGIQTYNKDAWEANVELNIKIVLTSDKGISLLGSYLSALNPWMGTLKNIKLTKADGSDNRFYESVIESETQPTTLELVDSISGNNGAMINFPAGEAWTDKYNLAAGTWDMSNRELVSFSRSTKAWLDGKEYAPDVPRYTKNGELLLEGQATNLFPLAFPYNFYTYGGAWAFTQADEWTEVTNKDGNGFINLETNVGLKPYHKYAVYLTVKKTNDYHFNLRFYNPMVNNVFKHDLPLPPNTDTLQVVDAGDRLIIKTIHEFGSSVSVRLYPNDSDIVGYKLYVKDVMITDTLTATSYIPTNGAAVTRAADIATVRDK